MAKPMQNWIVIIIALVSFNSNIFAGGASTSGDAANAATIVLNKTTADNNLLTYPTPPIMDSEFCDTDLSFSLKIDGTSVELINESGGQYTDIEWIMGDGGVSQEDRFRYDYEQDGLFHMSVTLYDARSGCADFVAVSYNLNTQDETISYYSSEELEEQGDIINLTK